MMLIPLILCLGILLQYVKQLFTTCNDLKKKQQFCFILARHVSHLHFYLQLLRRQAFCSFLCVSLIFFCVYFVGTLFFKVLGGNFFYFVLHAETVNG